MPNRRFEIFANIVKLFTTGEWENVTWPLQDPSLWDASNAPRYAKWPKVQVG